MHMLEQFNATGTQQHKFMISTAFFQQLPATQNILNGKELTHKFGDNNSAVAKKSNHNF